MSQEERKIQYTKILLAIVFLVGALYVANDIHFIRESLTSICQK